MVKKKDGSNKECASFMKLNKITEVDLEPMTAAKELFRRLSGKKYLSKIYLILADTGCSRDLYKTVFVTPDGQYEFLQMPSGMANSSATLIRGLKKVLEGFQESVVT